MYDLNKILMNNHYKEVNSKKKKIKFGNQDIQLFNPMSNESNYTETSPNSTNFDNHVGEDPSEGDNTPKNFKNCIQKEIIHINGLNERKNAQTSHLSMWLDKIYDDTNQTFSTKIQVKDLKEEFGSKIIFKREL
mmetsp:Transcript_32773/g.29063  ORF Transcript_32773/g.29063 Transcript_32773/m.29063 type:complete len:134 (+) Transcript_32773:752-1153(+)